MVQSSQRRAFVQWIPCSSLSSDDELGTVRGRPKRASGPLSPNRVIAEIRSLERVNTRIPLAR